MNKKQKFYQKKRVIIPILIGLALIFLAIFGSILSMFILTSNNAYILEYSNPVISKIEGKIININIQNNETVNKGEIIATLDDSEHKKELLEKQKEFEEIQKTMKSFENDFKKNELNIQLAQKNIQQAKINLENANDDYVRYRNEYKDGTVTKKDLDKAIKNLEIAQQNYQNSQEELEKAGTSFKNVISKKDTHNKKMEQALEELQEAKLELSNTVIIAQKSGTITNLDIAINNKIEENQKIADIILDECFIVANFNKIHKDNLKIGEKASVKIYSLGFKSYNGEITEIMPETSNLIPVKIKINDLPKKNTIKTNTKAFVKIKIN